MTAIARNTHPWPYIDKVLAFPMPRLSRDVEKYHAGQGASMREVFGNQNIEQIDEILESRLNSLLLLNSSLAKGPATVASFVKAYKEVSRLHLTISSEAERHFDYVVPVTLLGFLNLEEINQFIVDLLRTQVGIVITPYGDDLASISYNDGLSAARKAPTPLKRPRSDLASLNRQLRRGRSRRPVTRHHRNVARRRLKPGRGAAAPPYLLPAVGHDRRALLEAELQPISPSFPPTWDHAPKFTTPIL